MKKYHIEDFPKDKIRVLLGDDCRIKFWNTLKSILGSDSRIAEIVNYPRSTITKMRQGKNSRGTTYFIPFWMILKFSKILVKNGFDEFSIRNIEKNIIAYKTWSTSSVITEPKLPLVEDERLIRIFTHLVGDGYGGGIYKNPNKRWSNYESPQYTNTNEDLVNEFIEDLKVFGNVPYNKKNKWNCFKVIIPFSIKYILEKIYNVEMSASKGNLPKRFFDLPKKLIYQVIKAFSDDEGTVQDNGIVVSSYNKKQLEDLKQLMIIAGFDEKFITNVKPQPKNCYNLKFYGPNFLLFGKEIGFTHPEKQETLDFQINRHLNPKTFVAGETKKNVIKFLKENNLTSLQLAKKLSISQNWTGVYLRNLKKEGLLKCTRIPGKNKIAYILKK
jgi:hypothetical protein